MVKSAGGEVEECKGLGNEPGRGGGWEHTWAQYIFEKRQHNGMTAMRNEWSRARKTCRAILKSDKLRVNKFGPKIFV